MSEPKFSEGIYFNLPHDKAPDFVKGSIGINVDVAVKWLQENKNSTGYVNLDLKISKNGKAYAQVNEWEPGQKSVEPPTPGSSYTAVDGGPYENDDIPW